MEFASEMVIKAAKRGLRITEIPIVYRPREGESKLNSVRDAWRHVRFMLVHSATFLFLVPGTLLVLGGLAMLVPLAVDRHLGSPEWTVPVAILSSFLTVVGAQVVQLGLFARTYAVVYMSEEEPMLEALWRRFRLEHGLVAAAITLLAGILIALVANFDGVPDPALGFAGIDLRDARRTGDLRSVLSQHPRPTAARDPAARRLGRDLAYRLVYALTR